jgi:hypothetical protein
LPIWSSGRRAPSGGAPKDGRQESVASELTDLFESQKKSGKSRENPRLGAECIVGAVREEDYVEMLKAIGFTEIETLRQLDYFSARSSADTKKAAASFGARPLYCARTRAAERGRAGANVIRLAP